ncbi:LCP family protein [bacterium]|nr:LCP family protein [bacterium]
MNFKVRQIKHKKNNSSNRKQQVGFIVAILAIVVLFFYGCSAVVSKIGLINIIGIFGEQLKTDSYGNTNVLLIGAGGEGHDGADLTDTIILASIDKNNKLIPMLSIPRDFYVNIDEIGGGVRINRVYELGKKKYGTEEGIELMKKTIEDITGINIHYYVFINFSGFKDIVDSLDGVDLNVENAIYDPYYPLGETIKYQTFSLPAGMQHLDGDTALKYVRSRKTTSDFDRSKRQQKLLFAIKEKAMSKKILLNPDKIKSLYNSVSNNIETNFSIRQIIELAKISQDFNRDNIVAHVITDDPTSCGGFLYVPEKDLFGGAYVLVPIGNNYNFIHQYADLIFHYPDATKNKLKFQILNGTKTHGLAGDAKAILNRLCFNVTRFGNAQNQEIKKTTLFYKTQEMDKATPEALYFLKQLIPSEISTEVPPVYSEPQYASDANIIIELGDDYARNKPEDIFYQYYPTAKPAETKDLDSDTESSTPTPTDES